MELSIACSRCSYTASLRPEDGYPYYCPACDSILYISYDAGHVSRDAFRACFDQPGAFSSMWRYAPLLPVPPGTEPVTLHEGGTPLVRADVLADTGSGVQVYVKDETRNPTGSFKDRPVSLGVTYGLAAGYRQLIVASSGNAAVSTAAYAAKAAIPAIVVVPRTASTSSKLRQARAYGARVLPLDGDYNDVFRIVQGLRSYAPMVDLTTTYLSPIPTEANKTVAYELYEQMGGQIPDWVLVPVGSGPLLWGAWKGYTELVEAGLATRVPRMVAVQATGCAPIADAYAVRAGKIEPCLQPRTVADGIADGLLGHEQDGSQTLAAIYDSEGASVAVEDEVTLTAVKELARKAGVFAEPTGAISLAGMWELARRGLMKPGESAVLLVTGHGLKRPDAVDEGELELVPARIEAAVEYLGIDR